MQKELLVKFNQMDFQVEGDAAIGVFNEYPLMLQIVNVGKEVKCNVIFATIGYNAEQLKTALPANSAGRNIIFNHQRKKAAFFSFDIIDMDAVQLAESLDRMLQMVTKLLLKYKIVPEKKCCICREADIDDYTVWQDRFDPQRILMRPCHSRCVEEFLSKSNNSVEDAKEAPLPTSDKKFIENMPPSPQKADSEVPLPVVDEKDETKSEVPPSVAEEKGETKSEIPPTVANEKGETKSEAPPTAAPAKPEKAKGGLFNKLFGFVKKS